MDIIHLLPDSVANQIAAGEVIQRPASCLKELVENSLDAGARHIRVIIRDAGRTLLQVVDDGSGMSETDVRMAFERHATSKISRAEDLFTLRTMGFRGEALPSICAVSQVEIMTRRAEDEVGTLLEIHGSEVVRQEICECPVGTNIKVKNLFYNIPVRRKFLKTDQTERRNLITEFNHIVLVYPHVQFTLVDNDEIVSELTPGTDKQRIEQVFGKGTGRSFTSGLVDIHTETEMVTIRGFIGKPELANRQPQQFFFVNGRYMRHPYFHKAVLSAYQGLLPGDLNPSYFIYFDVNPDRIDVNIHPTKTEIKFADEQAVFQMLLATVRESLGKFNVAPSLDFDREGELEMPLVSSIPAATPQIVVDPTYTPFHPQTYHRQSYEPKVQGWEQLYEPQPDFKSSQPSEDTALFNLDLEAIVPYQYDGRYILLPAQEGLLIINQHRAHYTVLCAELLENIAQQHTLMQQVLFPEVLELTPEEQTVFLDAKDELQALGFNLEQLSIREYSIMGIPAILGANSAVPVLHNILAHVRETQSSARTEWQKQIALTLAKETAIPYGKQLSEVEIRDLLSRLFNLPTYRFAPDGKRVVSVLSDDEISKRF